MAETDAQAASGIQRHRTGHPAVRDRGHERTSTLVITGMAHVARRKRPSRRARRARLGCRISSRSCSRPPATLEPENQSRHGGGGSSRKLKAEVADFDRHGCASVHDRLMGGAGVSAGRQRADGKMARQRSKEQADRFMGGHSVMGAKQRSRRARTTLAPQRLSKNKYDVSCARDEDGPEDLRVANDGLPRVGHDSGGSAILV